VGPDDQRRLDVGRAFNRRDGGETRLVGGWEETQGRLQGAGTRGGQEPEDRPAILRQLTRIEVTDRRGSDDDGLGRVPGETILERVARPPRLARLRPVGQTADGGRPGQRIDPPEGAAAARGRTRIHPRDKLL
jgi:hypothetical protein